MKHLLTLTFLLFIVIGFSNNEPKTYIELTDDQKVISLISDDLAQEESIHMVFYKDKSANNFGVKAVFINHENIIHHLPDMIADDELSLVSFHKRGDLFTILLKQGSGKKQELVIADVNLTDNTLEAKNLGSFEEPKAMFSYPFKTVFLTIENDEFIIEQFANTKAIKKETVKVPNEFKDAIKDFEKGKIDVVNTSKFNANGPIGEFRAYAKDDVLMLENLDTKTGSSTFYNLDIANLNLSKEVINNNEGKIENADSYLVDDKHFTLSQKDKEDYELSITDITNGEQLYKASLQGDLKSNINSNQWQDFVKNAKKNRNSPTITVNNGKNKSLIATVDYVDVNTYYYNDWYWMHRWNMQMMQDMNRMNNQLDKMIRMPSPIPYDDALFFAAKEKTSFEIVFDENLKPVKNGDTETLIFNFDEAEYKDKILENKNIENVSVAYTKGSKRMLTQMKKSNRIKISTRD